MENQARITGATPELRRSIGLTRATAMVVGIIIGASIFVQPSDVTRQVPSVVGVLAVWLLAGTPDAVRRARVRRARVGVAAHGRRVCLSQEAYSPALGFLWGWAMFWTMHTGIVAAIAMVFARYAGTFVPLSDVGTRMVAIGAVAALSALNCVGVRPASAVQAALTLDQGCCDSRPDRDGIHPWHRCCDVRRTSRAHRSPSRASSRALVAGLFAFGGWHMVTYAAEETVDPARTIPRALVAWHAACDGALRGVERAPTCTCCRSTR